MNMDSYTEIDTKICIEAADKALDYLNKRIEQIQLEKYELWQNVFKRKRSLFWHGLTRKLYRKDGITFAEFKQFYGIIKDKLRDSIFDTSWSINFEYHDELIRLRQQLNDSETIMLSTHHHEVLNYWLADVEEFENPQH